jgi:catechol 2,3-dioxygenase-like lactoylglutathione lyase family enzyme
MKQSIVHVALVVKDYDEAITFYTQKLNFELIEDRYQPEQDKRWVVVSPPGSKGVIIQSGCAPKDENFVGRALACPATNEQTKVCPTSFIF